MYPLNTICDMNFDDNIDNYINTKCYSTFEFRKTCLNCNKSLINCSYDNYGTYQAIIFYSNKPPENCLNSYIKCKYCLTLYFKSYYINEKKDKYFYNDFYDSDFISFTNKTIYDKKIFLIFMADLHYKHSSFKAFRNAHNANFKNLYNLRNKLDLQTFIEHWFYLQLLLYIKEYDNLTTFVSPFIDDLDQSIKKIKNSLFVNFVKKWTGPSHTNFLSIKIALNLFVQMEYGKSFV